MKILVIQKKRIGDVLISSVIFEALKKKYPTAELHYLIYENSIAVVKNNPYINKIVILNEKARKSKREFFKFLYSIRKEKYDVVIDSYGKPNSVLIGFFSGATKTIGFSKPYTKLLFSNALERPKNSFSKATKAIEHRMLLLEPLGIPFEIIKPKIYLTDQEIDNAKETLKENNIKINFPIVMISALGSNAIKTYPLKYLAQVIDSIAVIENIQILFNYIPFQKDEAYKLYKLCNSNTQKKIFIDFYEPDLRKFLAITSQCKALIGNEGGATNMAKALNVPTFTIFSPSVPKEDWNIFENDNTNISVHIKDYIKNIEENTTIENQYSLFEPNLFIDKLQHFLNYNFSK